MPLKHGVYLLLQIKSRTKYIRFPAQQNGGRLEHNWCRTAGTSLTEYSTLSTSWRILWIKCRWCLYNTAVQILGFRLAPTRQMFVFMLAATRQMFGFILAVTRQMFGVMLAVTCQMFGFKLATTRQIFSFEFAAMRQIQVLYSSASRLLVIFSCKVSKFNSLGQREASTCQ